METVQGGIQFFKWLDSLWGNVGMHVRKWVSHSSATPEADRTTKLSITVGQEPVVKTLCNSRNSTEDTLLFQPQTYLQNFQLQSQNVLRKAATIFDPLGFVGPFVIKAKILLQEL